MREILLKSSYSYQEKFLGSSLHVLWEKAIPIDESLWKLSGLTDNYLRVCTLAPSAYYNQNMTVLITSIRNGELVGEFPPSNPGT
jgi:hypothetical protein